MLHVLLDQVQAEPAQGVRLPRPESVIKSMTSHDLPRPGAVRVERLQVRRRPRLDSTLLVLIRRVSEVDGPVWSMGCCGRG